MTKTVITGADTGLGLSFVKQYAQAGHDVVAGCLFPHLGQIAKLGGAVSNICPLKLDVTGKRGLHAFISSGRIADHAASLRRFCATLV